MLGNESSCWPWLDDDAVSWAPYASSVAQSDADAPCEIGLPHSVVYEKLVYGLELSVKYPESMDFEER